jgi:hypothetical protein
MKIVSLIKDDEKFYGFFSTEKEYRRFNTIGRDVVLKESYSTDEYKDYLHFVWVMGKFDPYTQFLAKPFKIEELNYDGLEGIWGKIEGE